jgi:hypothetical protein
LEGGHHKHHLIVRCGEGLQLYPQQYVADELTKEQRDGSQGCVCQQWPLGQLNNE